MVSGQGPKVGKLQGDTVEMTLFSVEKTKVRYRTPDNYSKCSCKDGSMNLVSLVADEVRRDDSHKLKWGRFRLDFNKTILSGRIV